MKIQGIAETIHGGVAYQSAEVDVREMEPNLAREVINEAFKELAESIIDFQSNQGFQIHKLTLEAKL